MSTYDNKSLSLKKCYSLVSIDNSENCINYGAFARNTLIKDITLEQCYTNNDKMFGNVTPYWDNGQWGKVDQTVNYSPTALSNSGYAYITACPVENMKGITAAISMSNLGNAYVVSDGYPILAVFNTDENAISIGVDSVATKLFDGGKGTEAEPFLDGARTRERHITRQPIVPGNQGINRRYGCSNAFHNPFIALCDKNATKNHGNVYGFNLVYSGNFTAGAERNSYNSVRAYIGINPTNFQFVLENGESFQTPEAVLVYSANGIGKMSRIYHKLYRTRLCRGEYRDTERFVLINNWEATYFDFNEDKIVEIADKAAKIGIDTMVLDYGWFSSRINDSCGLGDWYENRDRFPNGLEELAKRINDLGMRLGLWFEPEMVNLGTELYKNHPDWILHTKGRKPSLSRNQFTLDFSRDDVCDYIIDTLSGILSRANIEYIKWDMNRCMSEPGSAFWDSAHQDEVMHRYILGLYRVLETITSRFLNILFESCSNGGARFDAGMLYYMPQTCTSDDSDAVERLKIQYGTSIVYQFSAMGAHVSAVPNHQVGRITSFDMRCNVAMAGQFGFELELNKCTEEELKTAEKAVKTSRELGEVFHKGDYYRNRQISVYIDTREIMKVAEHNGKFCNIPKHGRKLK